MENVSVVTSFIMTAYTALEDYRYLYFMCFLILYILTLLFNSVLILTICTERGLHEPMYLFICNLAVNGVFGSTALLPSMLGHLLSQNYERSVTHCLLQIYFLFVYGTVEFAILAVMSYDRYVAICHPLHYHLLMSPRKVYVAIVLPWAVAFAYIAFYFMPTFQLLFCERHIEKVYCSKFSVQKLSCFDTHVEYIVGMSLLLVNPVLPIVMILFSYAQILRICLFASKESQIKALKTCIPHLVTVINYTVGVFFELLESSFNMSNVPRKARIFLSLYFVIIPQLFNPMIYGMSIQAIKVQMFKIILGKSK